MVQRIGIPRKIGLETVSVDLTKNLIPFKHLIPKLKTGLKAL